MMFSRVIEEFGSGPVLLREKTWPEVGAMQEGEVLLMPVGATEQHGPHLGIGTDTILAEEVCAWASAATGAPMAPAMPYTVSVGHTAKWPGTFSLSHGTFVEMVCELVGWAVATGWSRVLLVNAHFGNDASLRVAVDRLRTAHLGTLQVGCRNTFQLSAEIWEEFISDAADLHANKAETDLMLHLAPEAVRMACVVDDPDRTTGSVFSYPVAQTSLNGVTGKPSEGNAEDGAVLFAKMGAALAGLVERGRVEAPPLEEEHWQVVTSEISR